MRCDRDPHRERSAVAAPLDRRRGSDLLERVAEVQEGEHAQRVDEHAAAAVPRGADMQREDRDVTLCCANSLRWGVCWRTLRKRIQGQSREVGERGVTIGKGREARSETNAPGAARRGRTVRRWHP